MDAVSLTAPDARALPQPAALGGMGRIGLQAWVLLFVGAAGTTLVSVAEVRPLVQLLWVVPVLVMAMRVRSALPKSVSWALVGVLVAYGVASIASRNPWMSLETAGFGAAAAALFVVAAAMTSSTRVYVARAVLIAVGAWLAALDLAWSVDALAWLTQAGWPPPGEPTRSYLWLAGNAIPVLVLVTVPFIRWLGADPVDRWLARALVGLAVPAVLLSGGVIGMLGIGVAALAYLALTHLRTGPRILAAGGMAVVVVGAVAAMPALGIDLPVPSTVEARAALWEQGAAMLTSDPLTGTGPGTTALVRREFVDPHAAAVLTDHLHSFVVQAAAEGGLLLLAALLAAAAAWTRCLWRARRQEDAAGRLVVACLAGVGATFLADSFFDVPAIVAMVITVAAWSVSVDPPAPAARPSPRPMRFAIGVLVIASVVPVVAADGSRLMASAGRSAALAGDWSAALDAFQAAASMNPGNPLYRLEAGESARSLGRVDLAEAHFRAATAMAPGDGRAWGALASVAADADLRIELLAAAAARADGDAQYAFRLGAALDAAGRTEDASLAYAEAVALQPDLLAALPESGDGATRADVLRVMPATLERVAEAARLDRAAIGWDLQLLAGGLDPQAPAAWQAVAAAREGDFATARARLDDARASAPTDPRTWQAAAAVATLQCLPREADRALALEALLPGSHRFTRAERLRSWERVYREASLGDFQPNGLVPRDERWPAPFVALEASCP